MTRRLELIDPKISAWTLTARNNPYMDLERADAKRERRIRAQARAQRTRLRAREARREASEAQSAGARDRYLSEAALLERAATLHQGAAERHGLIERVESGLGPPEA